MAAPFDDRMPQVSERQKQILERVQSQGFATIESLALEFDVSAQTIRRDIIRLDSLRLLQRFHGGAGLSDHTVRLGYARKSQVSADRKDRIADLAVGLVEDGTAVFLDVGTTVEAVARALIGHDDLKIFTNSIHCAAYFPEAEHETYVTGGTLAGADGSLVGERTVESLAAFRFDVTVIGCSAIEADGAVMDFDLRKVAVKQAAMRSSRCTVLVADASKFGRQALIRIAPLDAFDYVVTDEPLPGDIMKRLKGAKTTVLTGR